MIYVDSDGICKYQELFLLPFWFAKLSFLRLIFLFIFGCTGSLSLHAAFLSLWWAGAGLHCSRWASHCSSFSRFRSRALGALASVVVVHGRSSCGSQALKCWLSSSDMRTELPCCMWDSPRPGIKTVSLALTSRFLTTRYLGSPLKAFISFSCLTPLDRFSNTVMNINGNRLIFLTFILKEMISILHH